MDSRLRTGLLLAILWASAPTPGRAQACSTGVGCQLPQGGFTNVYLSQDSVAVADDFTALSTGDIGSICWWGVYIDLVSDCGPGPGDSFEVTYYDANATDPSIPGPVLAGPLPLTVQAKFKTGNQVGTYDEWQFEATHAPVPVLSGRCYWVSIVNAVSSSCETWLLPATSGNGGAAQTLLGAWAPLTDDVAFCVDVSIAPSGCGPSLVNYCTAGTSASGCQSTLSAFGLPSATSPAGFSLVGLGVEGGKDGLFFFGTGGRQANPWGSGTSFQCVVPPVQRGGLLTGQGANGTCDGFFSQDLNALWCPSCPKPGQNPGVGSFVQAQLWYRDPQNTSNQTTSLSDALEFLVGP